MDNNALVLLVNRSFVQQVNLEIWVSGLSFERMVVHLEVKN